MSSLYRYFSDSRWAGLFCSGEIYCNPLSYFQKIEDNQARGDSKEGVSVFEPTNGLTINNLTSGNSFVLDGHSFQSAARAEQIYVYCMSLYPSNTLANKFNAVVCIEIRDVPKFCSLAEQNLPKGFALPAVSRRLRIGHKVRYYDVAEPPSNLWALPELMAISKRKHYSWQNEFRLVFGRQGVFDFQKAEQTIQKSKADKERSLSTVSPIILQIGDISKLCKIHVL
jgi:hypothetical protein